ncbi:unnamed protein product [Laminaria digitata]
MFMRRECVRDDAVFSRRRHEKEALQWCTSFMYCALEKKLPACTNCFIQDYCVASLYLLRLLIIICCVHHICLDCVAPPYVLRLTYHFLRASINFFLQGYERVCSFTLLGTFFASQQASVFSARRPPTYSMPPPPTILRPVRYKGPSLANEMLIMGRKLSAQEALSAGLVSTLVAADSQQAFMQQVKDDLRRTVLGNAMAAESAKIFKRVMWCNRRPRLLRVLAEELVEFDRRMQAGHPQVALKHLARRPRHGGSKL